MTSRSALPEPLPLLATPQSVDPSTTFAVAQRTGDTSRGAAAAVVAIAAAVAAAVAVQDRSPGRAVIAAGSSSATTPSSTSTTATPMPSAGQPGTSTTAPDAVTLRTTPPSRAVTTTGSPSTTSAPEEPLRYQIEVSARSQIGRHVDIEFVVYNDDPRPIDLGTPHIDWGDGTSEDYWNYPSYKPCQPGGRGPSARGPFSVHHTCAAPGTYTVTVSAETCGLEGPPNQGVRVDHGSSPVVDEEVSRASATREPTARPGDRLPSGRLPRTARRSGHRAMGTRFPGLAA